EAFLLRVEEVIAIRDFDAALNVEPSNVMFLNNRALAHLEAGSSRSALKDLQSALLIVPDFTEALNNRGIVYMRSEDHSSALKDFNAALKLDPKFVDALGNRASALRKQGRYSEAVLDLENAIRISPGKFEAVNDLAWLLATCPDNSIRNTSRALTLARQACDMTDYRQWNTLDTLAAALAGEGQFSEAARHAAESVEMAPRDERRRIRGHLDTITAGKPVREQLR
ncbi:MAG: tetratricopeptide repeat protein, partial [Planctomycetaceae bacterium]